MVELRDGYVVDLIYAPNWRSELSPASVSVMLMMNGMEPLPTVAPTCLELGFGRGLSLNVIAAANQGAFHGVDFIQAHVDEARDVAALSGAPLTVSAAAFTDFAAEDGGEDFDLITLHGVWSWVDDAARAAIANILARRLKPGGAALISYNTPAGWKPLDPLRELFLLNSAASGADPATAMASGVALADRLKEVGGRYFTETPAAARQLDKIRNADPHYLVHEYLNEGHRTLSFAETSRLLAGADLHYAGPARYAEFIDRRRLPAEAAKIIEDIADQNLAEMARDLLQPTRFRSDLYIKGGLRPRGPDATPLLNTSFIAQTDHVDLSAEKALRELGEALFDAIAAAEGPMTFAEMIAAMEGHPVGQVSLAIMKLCSMNVIAPLALAGAENTARAHNAAMLARCEEGFGPLASPVTGGHVPAPPIHLMFLAALEQGGDNPARFAWDILKAQGKVAMKDGAALQGDAANLAHLQTQFDEFSKTTLPIFQRLGVI